MLFNLVRETTDHVRQLLTHCIRRIVPTLFVCCVQGPFNSWDRVPYVTLDPKTGVEVVGPRLNTITRNLVLANYKSTWPIDHGNETAFRLHTSLDAIGLIEHACVLSDDGSNNYLDSHNALWCTCLASITGIF